MAELYKLSASEAAALMEKNKITSEDLVRACLARIEEREETVQAWQYLDPDFAIDEARKADAAERKGPLHGIPFATKDIIDTADMPTENGSPIYAGRRPDVDAPCVTAMRACREVTQVRSCQSCGAAKACPCIWKKLRN